jgi:hypothetical protein
MSEDPGHLTRTKLHDFKLGSAGKLAKLIQLSDRCED